MSLPTKAEFRTSWLKMLDALGLPLDAPKTIARATADFELVYDAYSSPSRHYHNLSHLHMVTEWCCIWRDLSTNDETPDDIKQDFKDVEAALWFHDVVYDCSRTDNEECSARFAVDSLIGMGLSEERAERIGKIVEATKHDDRAATNAEKMACDFDLLSLAIEEKEFHKMTDELRKEYPFLSDSVFKAGRTQFVERFLDKERIYYSDDLEEMYGEAARNNLAASLRRLSYEH